jgi:hypothetical protein
VAAGAAVSYAAPVLLLLTLACTPAPECTSVPVGDCSDVQHCTYEGTEYWQIGEANGIACADATCETAFEEVVGECIAEGTDCRGFVIGTCENALTCCTDEACFYLNADVIYACDAFDCAQAQEDLGMQCGVAADDEDS